MTANQKITDLGVIVQEAPQDALPDRVTIDSIEAKIVREDILTGINGGRMTVCILTLANGFTVAGESACVDPANFDAQLGAKIARENAFEKIWPLEGYLLRERMAEREATHDHGHDAPDENSDAVCASVEAFSPNRDEMDAEYRRARAMELAVVGTGDIYTTENLIDRAKAIEAFLRGENDACPGVEAVGEGEDTDKDECNCAFYKNAATYGLSVRNISIADCLKDEGADQALLPVEELHRQIVQHIGNGNTDQLGDMLSNVIDLVFADADQEGAA